MANFIPELCFKDLKHERWVQYKIIALTTQKAILGNGMFGLVSMLGLWD